jgi:hypothetical protein
MRSPLPPPICSPGTSLTSWFQMLPAPATLKPEDHWAFKPFFVQTLAFGPRGHVINNYLFGMFEHL